jgi:putative peptidoglycan lipid II flippase
VLAVILLGIVLLAEIFMPAVVLAFAPGFDANAEKFALAVLLSRVCFPYIFFISLLTLYGGILNSLHRFSAGAAAPILLNLCMIAALLLAPPVQQEAALWLSVGVALAGVAQFGWMARACWRVGLLPRLRRPRFSAPVKRLLTLAIPAAFGASVAQVNQLIDLILASNLPDAAISWLYYGDRLNELVIGVIGVAIGTALLPMLSRAIKAGDDATALHRLNQGTFFSMLLAFPAAVALAVIAEPLIITLFEQGEFGTQDTAAVAPTLLVYSLGLPAFVMTKILSPGFYAREDTKTPVKIGVFCVVLNLCGNLLLMPYLQHVGLALSTSIAAWVNTLAMAWVLHCRGHFLPDATLKTQCRQIALASTLMGAVLWLTMDALSWNGKITQMTHLALLIAAGGFTYLAAMVFMDTRYATSRRNISSKSA